MRIALGIEYDGAKYYGWQRQREVNSVQQELERVLSSIADHPVDVHCAGRTDAGVHATGQVVHFDCQNARELKAWTLGANARLPSDVGVRWAKEVGDEFHARYSATARRYRYIIFNNRLRPAILVNGLSHYPMPLDADKMHQAAQCLVGEQDFSAFRAIHCQSKSPFRCVYHCRVTRENDFVIIDIKANAFVHHMVRNIAGSLIAIGQGQKPIEWMAELLAEKDRTKAAATGKAGGLYLVEVDYPAQFELPQVVAGPLFLA